MEFHEELHNLGTKEGLKGRKLSKAIESFAWNITVLKVSTESTTLCSVNFITKPLLFQLIYLYSFMNTEAAFYFFCMGCICHYRRYPQLLKFMKYRCN